jgi:hypothetical protein
LLSRKCHGDKIVIERQKREDLLHRNSSFGDVVPDSATVDEGHIRACLLSHGVAYKIAYVGFALVIPYQRNRSLTDDFAVFFFYPAIVGLNDSCQPLIIWPVLAGHNFFKLFFLRMAKDLPGIGIYFEF